jgi:GT2 family glycosyltransferase
MKNKLGLIILNFLTYEDTYISIKTLNKNLVKDNIELEIFIVDNQTDQKKYQKLKENISFIDINIKIFFLQSKKNLGFSRGMNIGIDKARESKCNFIICSNNDIIYKSKIDLYKFIYLYKNNSNIAIIGPKIFNPDGINQNPYLKNANYKSKLIQKIIYTNVFGKMLFFLKTYLYRLKTKEAKKKNNNLSSMSIYSLHGSYFILTPSYFKYYENLDPNTFLYSEELILAERLKKHNMLMYYTNDLEVFHKDDSSTNEMLGKDSFKKSYFILNENYKSYSYFLKEYIWKK